MEDRSRTTDIEIRSGAIAVLLAVGAIGILACIFIVFRNLIDRSAGARVVDRVSPLPVDARRAQSAGLPRPVWGPGY